MLVKVSRIEPNPHRQLEKYPITEQAIEKMKASINKTGFWDNIMARPHPTKEGHFQLAYGHTRLATIKALEIEKIDLIVKDIDDMKMLLILADENKEDDDDPSRVNETVYAVRKYLNEEFAKAKTIDNLPERVANLLDLKGSKIDKLHTIEYHKKHWLSDKKTKGAGAITIRNFLGGEWSQTMISESLATLNAAEKTDKEEGAVDIKAVESFPNTHQATAFRIASQTYKVPKKRTKRISR